MKGFFGCGRRQVACWLRTRWSLSRSSKRCVNESKRRFMLSKLIVLLSASDQRTSYPMYN